MEQMHYTACPVCHSVSIQPFLTVKDYLVSGETFAIWQCRDCSLRFTQDAPTENRIARYYKSDNYISHTNTSNGIINRLYLRIRKITLGIKSNTIKKYTGITSGNVLDVGAGTGAFLHYMQQQGWSAIGVEPDADARNVAQQTFNLRLHPTEVLKTLPEHSFDAITLWHVLEHIHQLHDYMRILKSLLKPRGRLFIAVPNYQSPDARIYKTTWAAYDVPRHLYHFSPQAVSSLVQQHGLTVMAQKPMWFDAFYISLLSSKYKNGRTNWIGALTSGVRATGKTILNKNNSSSIIYVVQRS